MRVLQKGMSGTDVRRWQAFLVGQGFQLGEVDGKFGDKTLQATIQFQQKHGLTDDGKVGNKTLGAAMLRGFEAISDAADVSQTGPNFPPPPGFPPLVGTIARQAVFGKFSFEPQPLPSNAENIKLLGTWQKDNIVNVTIPQLIGVKGAPKTGVVPFHRLAAAQFQALWQVWDQAGLLDRVLTWGGSFVPRFIRGSQKTLSNHSFGSAFDINAAFNPLGTQPALVGQKGSVRELVSIANEHGLYWGGHFQNRRDGMHFEVAVIKQ
jgi:hypothetical protein